MTTTKKIWERTPEEAAQLAGVPVERLRELSSKAYLYADTRRVPRGFEQRWRAWEQGRTTMPAIVEVVVKDIPAIERIEQRMTGLVR